MYIKLMHTDCKYGSVLGTVDIDNGAISTSNAEHDEADGVVNVINSCFNSRNAGKKQKENIQAKEVGKRGRKRKQPCEQPDGTESEPLREIDDNATDGFAGASSTMQDTQQQ